MNLQSPRIRIRTRTFNFQDQDQKQKLSNAKNKNKKCNASGGVGGQCNVSHKWYSLVEWWLDVP